MKLNYVRSSLSFVPGLCALASLLALSANATPYATSLTNAAGVVSFRLNQTTATNDTVLVISSGGSVTNTLQLPSGDAANFFARGLVTTNLGIAAGTFQVQITHIGSGQANTNGPLVPVNAPRGVAVNRNPASPYFGWVYMANSAAGTKGDGLFAFSSDLSDITGQGTTGRNGGYTGFASSTTFSPYRISVAPSDRILICDDSDPTGNLISMDPLLTGFQYVLNQIVTNNFNGFASSPVSSNNNHGSVSSAIIVGSGASSVLYTMDEDYQRDPALNTLTELNSVWQYNIGSSSFPYGTAPDKKLMTPNIRTIRNSGQNQEVVAGTNGILYAFQRRANPGQYGIYLADPSNPVDPTTYAGQGGYFWDSQTESLAEGWPDDLFRDVNGITVSQDGRWMATIYFEDLVPQTNSITGAVWAPRANDVVLVPLVNGIPNLPQRVLIGGLLGIVSAGRAVAFDAANNLYVASSGQALLQCIDIGESATTTTDSGGTFSIIVPSTQVSVTASTPVAFEQGAVAGVFTLTRTADNSSSPLTARYTLSGTASNGVDFVSVTNRVTFAPGELTTNIVITPIDDSIPELTESVILSLSGGIGYSVGIPNSAQIDLVDNETPQLRITSVSSTMFEANPYDYIALSLRRFGDTNLQVVLDATNFTFTGTAVSNVHFYLTNLPTVIDFGVVNTNLQLIFPIDNALVDGLRTVNITLLPGSGFTVSNNTASATIVDDDVPAETVLFSENFDIFDSSTNWVVYFATTNGAAQDYTLEFAHDYSADGIPPAPHSGLDTHGLYMTVNKDTDPAAAALNLYPILTNYNPALSNFSGDFGLRFDMFLIENFSGSGTVGTTEYALFGINHDGLHTNWFRSSPGGVPTGSTFDGLFYGVEADGAALGDYVLYSSPNTNNNPTALTPGRNASTLTATFKSPPWTTGAGSGGAPANQFGSGSYPTPSWAQVEISQIRKIVTLKINNTSIFSYSNATAFAQGNIMLGYDDAFDSKGVAGGAVIYDNVRVVRLAALNITSITIVGGNVQVDFSWGENDPATNFKLQSAAAVTGPYTDDNTATLSVLSPASSYRAVTALSGGTRFYRIRHL